ncbi:MAG: GH3 auxin-responsive promoter family protein [Acidobacteria bacterium]|nr:GH3 auxin-responsive promoter family protein [Acidobacteriota bacterium]
MIPRLVNGAWLASALPSALRFEEALRDASAAQEDLLAEILQANAGTAFGREHGFGRIRSRREFARRVPLATWDDLVPWIARVERGEPNVLTREPVRRLVPTSGASGARKLVPYGAPLLASFRNALSPWIVRLLREDAAVFAGRAYWSISPAFPEETTAGGLPIGFGDDTEYLGALGRLLARGALAVPPSVARLAAPELRAATRRALLAAPDLSLVSVWHPAFLLLLTRDLSAADAEGLEPGRRREVLGILRETRGDAGARNRRLWPRLRCISAWLDGPAADHRARLAAEFPGVRLEGKGLLATEGVVSLPWNADSGPVLALTSSVLELIDEARGDVLLPHEARPGQVYEVVLTTPGGLHRYRLGDLVEVTGFSGEAPHLRFVARRGAVSDRFGEKLTEPFVRSVVGGAVFALLSFEEETGGYVLFHEGPPEAPVAEALDAALRANPHYAWARDLGQLAALRVVPVERGFERFLASEALRGRRAGDVKPALLCREGNRLRAFGVLPAGLAATLARPGQQGAAAL